MENAALRAALSQAQLMPPGAPAPQQHQLQSNGSEGPTNGAHLEEAKHLEAVVSELKIDPTEATQEKTE